MSFNNFFEFGDFNHIEFALGGLESFDQMLLPNETFPVECVFDVLLLDESGLKQRDVLLLSNDVDLGTEWL